MAERATTGTVELLERSAELEALEGHLAAVRAQGRGRLVLVAGEAGIGKTALVRAFCERARPSRVLWGACDALFTPRPLGPFVDIADDVGGELSAMVAEGAAAGALLGALTRSLRGRPPDVVVLEDLHWADEATLDVLRLLARRIELLPALVLATYRDDEIDPRQPLRMVLGELPSGSAARLALAPLSAQGVAELAGLPDDIKWIRSYVLEEGAGSVGTVCVYQASSPEAIRKHAKLADLPVDEIIAVADTVIIRPDPQPAAA